MPLPLCKSMICGLITTFIQEKSPLLELITVIHLTLNMFWKPPPIAVGKYNPLALITVKSGYNADYRSRLASVKIAKLVYPVKALVKPSMLRVFPAAFCLNLGWTWWNLGHFWHNQDALVPSSMLNHHDHDHHNLYNHDSYHHHHHDHDHQTCLCLLAWSPSRQTEHALTFRRRAAISSCNRDLLNTNNQNQPEVEEYKIQNYDGLLMQGFCRFRQKQQYL